MQQFWRATTAGPLGPKAWADANMILGEDAMVLFGRQTAGGQRHSYQVMSNLRSTGHTEPALLQAALLHDAGKAQVAARWWDWPLVVLVEALAPSLAHRWAEGDAKGWRRPFVVKERHAEWGAEVALAAGCSTMTCQLIRRHQSPLQYDIGDDEDRLLRLLIDADNLH